MWSRYELIDPRKTRHNVGRTTDRTDEVEQTGDLANTWGREYTERFSYVVNPLRSLHDSRNG